MKYHFRHPDAAKSRLSLSIIRDYRLEPPALPCPALASRNRSRGGLLPLESGWRDRG